MEIIRGKVWKLGDNIDTDVILSSRYMNTSDYETLGRHCLEKYIPNIRDQIKPGDILVSGSNFGCGSSREHAPIAIKSAGFSCVIAKSFARIFYRNAINIGLPILIVPDLPDVVEQGTELTVDPFSGIIHDVSTNMKFKGEAFPPFLMDIIDKGGAINNLKAKA